MMAVKSDTLQIDALKQGRVTLRLVGSTGLYFNAMSAKAKRTLLIGGGKKTSAEKRELKHDPEAEFKLHHPPPVDDVPPPSGVQFDEAPASDDAADDATTDEDDA